ncbi:MAG: hypothetical protein NC548_34470 [Lachnospiraceae bacterium]|nr:hypothetical protein [Lachnospiraceae bacterium]
MAVEWIEPCKQRDGSDILKVYIKPTKQFPQGSYFYCNANDKRLVEGYAWILKEPKKPYVIANGGSNLRFHREKEHNILGHYPRCINHVNMVEFDNVGRNLDIVTVQQNQWSRPSKGYGFIGKRFQPRVCADYVITPISGIRTEADACKAAYWLEVWHEDYRYDFLKARRDDLDILDMERTGKISEDEAVYRHVCRYAKDNAWYVYRYNLFQYFAENHILVPKYTPDTDGFMRHPITGQRLCPV